MRHEITRGDFLKVAGTGAAGLALLGGSSVMSSRYNDYLPVGGPRMNVIVVIIDSLRKDHVGAYGNDWIQTPNLDALAKDSLRFERSHPESIPTIPARRAIHTGIRSWPFQKWEPPPGQDWVLYGWQPIPKDQITLSEILQGEGYRTMLVTDTWHQFKPFFDFHRGFDLFHFIRGQEKDAYKPDWTVSDKELEGILFGGGKGAHMRTSCASTSPTPRANEREEDWFSPQVFSKAGEVLEAASKGGQPFFMVVDSYDPHEPWHPQRGVPLPLRRRLQRSRTPHLPEQ